MRIAMGAEVVDAGGQQAGRLTGLVFERGSWRVAGFIVRVGGGLPREVVVQPGEVADVEELRLALTLRAGALARLPDAWQHLYVLTDQDFDAEVAAATGDAPAHPDPDERPRATTIPGFDLLPGYTTPLEVARAAVTAGGVALGADLRVLTADGAALGRLTAVEVEETRLTGVVVRDDRAGDDADLVIPADWLDRLDEDADALYLSVDRDGNIPAEAGGVAPAAATEEGGESPGGSAREGR
ncbi:MAG TPA: hypothetical protein VFW96_13215 [Thermomicrobiales bacterium]|nr:hypothetical protein [Thermomicrobiales bacterium]